jgi:hypothetical protein
MRSSLLAGALLSAVASPALSTIGPPIGYISGSTIFLVNPDGTGLAGVYTAPRKSTLSSLSLRPGGGEVAFVENHKLKILDYDDRGVATGAARSVSFPCGTILESDYAPDGSLAVKDGCAPNNIWHVAAGASSSDSSPVVTSGETIGDVMWSRDGARIYYDLADGIRSYDVATGTSTVISPDHSMWDVTQTGDRLILGGSNYSYFVHDLTSGNDTPGCTQAFAVHYGNNDTQMVYRSPVAHGGGSYILLINSDCSGAPFRITGKAGAYVGPDWAAP